MKKTFQVRDIDLIEKELKENLVGVLAVTLKNEKVVQSATPFLYLDKNIYILFNNDSEIYDDINLDINGSFIIIKNESLNGFEISNKYRLMSISISGAVKKVEEQKLLDELKKSYAGKYNEEEAMLTLNKALIIDTDEILALDEQVE